MRLQLLKLAAAVVALVFVTYKALIGLDIAINEPDATELTASDFATAYKGEKHLHVRGRLAMEHVALKPGQRGERGRINPRVAVVPADWTPNQEVRVVATFGAIDPAELERWRSDTQQLDGVVGLVGNHPKIAEELAPLRLAPDAVVVNHGTRPQLGPTVFLLGLMLVGLFFTVGTLRNVLRERNASRPSRSE